MSNDLNRVILIARLTRDSELKYTPNGTPVCSFSVANGRTYKQGDEKKKQTSYFDCTLWGKFGEAMSEYLKKGVQVGIEGRLEQRRWDDADGNKKSKIEIRVENLQLLSRPSDAKSPDNSIGTPVDIPADENPFNDSDIPF